MMRPARSREICGWEVVEEELVGRAEAVAMEEARERARREVEALCER